MPLIEGQLGKTEARLDLAHVADHAVLHELDDPGGQRVKPIHVGFGHEGARLAGGLEHGVRLRRRQTHRLLAEHVLALFGGLDRPFRVKRMDRRDVDRIDFRVVDQCTVAVDDARAREILGKAGLCRIAGADRDDLSVGGFQRAGEEVLRDGAGAENAPADPGRFVHIVPTLVWFEWMALRTVTVRWPSPAKR